MDRALDCNSRGWGFESLLGGLIFSFFFSTFFSFFTFCQTLEHAKHNGEEELSAKEVLFWQIGRKSAERTKDLERETGVSLEYYHKLNSRENVLKKPKVTKGKDDVKKLKVTEVLW